MNAGTPENPAPLTKENILAFIDEVAKHLQREAEPLPEHVWLLVPHRYKKLMNQVRVYGRRLGTLKRKRLSRPKYNEWLARRREERRESLV